jgi:hypothetical protein
MTSGDGRRFLLRVPVDKVTPLPIVMTDWRASAQK